MGTFQPPPTFTDPVLVDEKTGKSQFNPVWMDWFLRFAQLLQNAAAGVGVQHENLSGLQGGTTNEHRHLTAAEYTGVGTGVFVRDGGVTDGSNAAAGALGEIISTNFSSAISGSAANLTSIALTAGDWDVNGGLKVTGSATNILAFSVGVSSVSLNLGNDGTYNNYNGSAIASIAGALPTVRISVSGSTTIYLVGIATISSGTATATGILRARRVR